STRPVSGASGPSLTAPSDTAVLVGNFAAAGTGAFPPPPPPQAVAARRDPRPIARAGIRMRITGVNHTFVVSERICRPRCLSGVLGGRSPPSATYRGER